MHLASRCRVHPADSVTAAALLRAATQLVDGIQAGLRQRGFDDVRPVHGYAFARISAPPATTADLAVHLGISKQAAAQMVAHLVARGYVRREPDLRDARARQLVLTERGRACTAAAEQASADVIGHWRGQLSAQDLAHLQRVLSQIATPGPLRPAW